MKTTKEKATYVPYQKCPVCDGTGEVYVHQIDPYRTNITQGYQPCRVCGGRGVIPMHLENQAKD